MSHALKIGQEARADELDRALEFLDAIRDKLAAHEALKRST